MARKVGTEKSGVPMKMTRSGMTFCDPVLVPEMPSLLEQFSVSWNR
ncbi:hypothetical protein AB6802_03900 [Mesorhizobium sp. RCC_202]